MSKQKGASAVLIISTIAMAVAFSTWAALSLLAAQLTKSLGLSATEKSILVAIPVLLGSIMRIPLGQMTERFGGRRVYTSLMLFLIIPAIGLGFAHTYMQYIFWAFLLGMAGTSFSIGITSVSKWYPPEKQGLILGITGMGNIGTAIAGFVLPSIAKNYGIQWSFWNLIIPIFVSALLIFFGTKDPELPKAAKAKKDSFKPTREKMVWLLSMFYFLTFGAFVSFSVYLPSLLVDVFKITPVDAGMRAAGFVVLATFARPTGGYLADRMGANRVLSVVFLLLSVSAVTLSIAIDNLVFMTVACLLAGVVVGIGNGAVFKLVPQYFPKNTGVVTGIVGAAGGLGGFFPPIVMGAVKDATGQYSLGFLMLLVVTILCFVLNQRMGKKNKPNRPERAKDKRVPKAV